MNMLLFRLFYRPGIETGWRTWTRRKWARSKLGRFLYRWYFVDGKISDWGNND